MSDIIFQAENISKCYQLPSTPFVKSETLTAVDRLSISLHRGEVLGLAGESGCGKSTTARMLAALELPTSGRIIFEGKDLATLKKDEFTAFRKSVQMIFQDPYSALNPRMRIGDIIAEPLRIHRVAAGDEIRQQVLALMERTGLQAEQYGRYPHEFSGGQRQRIGIARALALSPQVLIADEPLSALDISIQAQIINLLIELRREFGLSYILISHDLAVIRHLCSRTAIMYLGRIVEEGATSQLFSSPLHPYTEALLAAVPELDGSVKAIAAPSSPDNDEISATACPFYKRCPRREKICLESPPELEEKRPGQFAACHLAP